MFLRVSHTEFKHVNRLLNGAEIPSGLGHSLSSFLWTTVTFWHANTQGFNMFQIFAAGHSLKNTSGKILLSLL